MKEENKQNQRPDAVPAFLSEGAAEPKFKKGDHVWSKRTKELAGRTGYVMAVNIDSMEYDVRFGTELWIVPESDLELVDPATYEARQPAFEREDDPAEATTDAPEAGQDTFDPAMAAMAASLELDKPRKTSWKDGAVRTIDRLTSWMLYSMTFCFLLGVAGLDLSAREIIAYSLMLGLVVGSINNIERVMRELFKQEG